MDNAICITAIFKDEYQFLKEWIEYHRLFGVDHFYLLQDETNVLEETISREVLQPYIDQGVVTLYQTKDVFPEVVPDRRRPFYDWALNQIRYENTYQWQLVLDVDQFVTLPAYSSIKELTQKFSDRDITGITLSIKNFGHGKTELIPTFSPESVVDTSLAYLETNTVRTIGMVKNIGYWHVQVPVGHQDWIQRNRPDAATSTATNIEQGWINPQGVSLTWDQIEKDHSVHDYSEAYCAHYVQRSKESLLQKYNNAVARRTQDKQHITWQRFTNWIYDAVDNKKFSEGIVSTEIGEMQRAKLAIQR